MKVVKMSKPPIEIEVDRSKPFADQIMAAYDMGVYDEKTRMIRIVEEMREAAQVMMNCDYDYACERFLAMINTE